MTFAVVVVTMQSISDDMCQDRADATLSSSTFAKSPIFKEEKKIRLNIIGSAPRSPFPQLPVRTGDFPKGNFVLIDIEFSSFAVDTQTRIYQ